MFCSRNNKDIHWNSYHCDTRNSEFSREVSKSFQNTELIVNIRSAVIQDEQTNISFTFLRHRKLKLSAVYDSHSKCVCSKLKNESVT